MAARAPANFSENLRVLLVDDDRVSLVMLKKMLEDCSYHVIACQSGEEALEMLINGKVGFHIIMSDVRMPGIDGLQLLAKIITLKIDSPVILFSDEPENEVIAKGVHGGACDFLAKPIHITTLKIIWKYLLRKVKSDGIETGSTDTPIASSVLHSDQQISQSNERDEDSLDIEQVEQSNVSQAGTKKPRMSWKQEAHNAFLEAIASFAPEKPLPKKILEYMETKHGIKGLTRQIISSHLQKHRENMKKLQPTSSLYHSSISLEISSRHQQPAYSQPMYKMQPHHSYHLQRFPENCFPLNVVGGYDAFPPSQPQIPFAQRGFIPPVQPQIPSAQRDLIDNSVVDSWLNDISRTMNFDEKRRQSTFFHLTG